MWNGDRLPVNLRLLPVNQRLLSAEEVRTSLGFDPPSFSTKRVCLFGPVLLTELYCAVSHVVSLRSTHACRTQSPLVARLATLLRKEISFRSGTTCQHPADGNELVSGLAGPQSPLWTCAANFCLGVIIPCSGRACPGVGNPRTAQPNRSCGAVDMTPLSPGLHQGTYREGLASCTCAAATLS